VEGSKKKIRVVAPEQALEYWIKRLEGQAPGKK
jgi:hypothetical protein